MHSCKVMKDSFRYGCCKVISAPVVFLMAINSNLKSQNSQHQKIVLQRMSKKTQWDIPNTLSCGHFNESP
jgi:hypothetical protein